MQRRPTDLNIAGAIDLSSLARPTTPAAPAVQSEHVFDVTEATFEKEVLERSMTVPVLIDFWASWCGPCKQLSPVLERMAEADGGAWKLAKIDVDANQALSGQLQVQSIPTVLLALGGRLVQGFTGALPEAQVRAFLDQVQAAAAQVLTGEPQEGEAPVVPTDPEIVAAEDALAVEDWAGAIASYDALLARKPGDAEATTGRAFASLLLRASHLDPAQVLDAADRAPQDVAAQSSAADVEVLSGQVQAAMDRLLKVVRRSAGDDRDSARNHLLELFAVLDPDDPQVAAGRKALASALF